MIAEVNSTWKSSLENSSFWIGWVGDWRDIVVEVLSRFWNSLILVHSFLFCSFYTTKNQTSAYIRITGGLIKNRLLFLPPEFLMWYIWVKPENWHLHLVPRWCWCYWSGDHTLSTTAQHQVPFTSILDILTVSSLTAFPSFLVLYRFLTPIRIVVVSRSGEKGINLKDIPKERLMVFGDWAHMRDKGAGSKRDTF